MAWFTLYLKSFSYGCNASKCQRGKKRVVLQWRDPGVEFMHWGTDREEWQKGIGEGYNYVLDMIIMR